MAVCVLDFESPLYPRTVRREQVFVNIHSLRIPCRMQPIKSGHVPATSEFPAPSEFPFIALSAQIPTPPLALV